ncbi:MAG: hypothetical protein HXL34_02520 [Prevotellaceae bacterium]|nr:hypothetical protein [Prevotellaceae bacterium]
MTLHHLAAPFPAYPHCRYAITIMVRRPSATRTAIAKPYVRRPSNVLLTAAVQQTIPQNYKTITAKRAEHYSCFA